MDPKWRLIFHFHGQRRADDDKSSDQDDKDRSPVVRIRKRIGQATLIAIGSNNKAQEPSEQVALAARGTSSHEPAGINVGVLVHGPMPLTGARKFGDVYACTFLSRVDLRSLF